MTLPEKKYCNCAECGKEAVAISSRLMATDGERIIGGHIKGRPYCLQCLAVRPIPGGAGRREDDGGPWQQNAVRSMEGE